MRPPRPWRLEPTLRFLATLMFAFAGSAVAMQGLTRLVATDPAHPAAWQLASATGIFHAAGIVALVPFLKSHQVGWREAFGLFASAWRRTGPLAVGLTLPAMATAWAVHQGSVALLEALGHAPDTQAAVDAVRSASGFGERAVLLLFAAGTAPIFEELVFRGVLWPAVRDRGFRWSGSLLVSGLFALIHANVAAFLPLALLGMFWIWLYEKTGDLAAPALSHALFNATNFVWILALPADLPTPP